MGLELIIPLILPIYYQSIIIGINDLDFIYPDPVTPLTNQLGLSLLATPASP